MTARIIDGKQISVEIRQDLQQIAQRLRAAGIIPGLAGILVGEDPGSVAYIGLKKQACDEIGIREMMCRLPASITLNGLLTQIDGLNHDQRVHGIFIQLPLPGHLSEAEALETVSPDKDVDGFHALNAGKAWMGQTAFLPAAAMAVHELIIRSGFDVRHKEVMIVNTDNMLGKPLASILIQDRQYAGANITLCQPSTPNLQEFTRRADFLVVQINRPRFITDTMVKPGAVVFDCGSNRVQDPVSGKTRTVGDIDFEAVKEKVGAITPVPGGVGPMLVTMLMSNTLQAAQRHS
jgi:methylenetetrahydrofolate dehydrogenase (NADP+)/methenyltetrahydrofolate cyclohydrolase